MMFFMSEKDAKNFFFFCYFWGSSQKWFSKKREKKEKKERKKRKERKEERKKEMIK